MKWWKTTPKDLWIILSNSPTKVIEHKLEFSDPFNLKSYIHEISKLYNADNNQNFLFYLKTNIIRLIYEMSRMWDRLQNEIKDVLIDLPAELSKHDCFREALDDNEIYFLTCVQNILAPWKTLIVGDSHVHDGSHPYPQLYPNQKLFDDADKFANLHKGNFILFMNSIIWASKLWTAHFQWQPSYSWILQTIAIDDDKKIPKNKIRDYVHKLNKKWIPNTVIALWDEMFALMIPDYFLWILGKNPYISSEELWFTLIPNAKNGYPLTIDWKINDFGIMAKELSNQIAIWWFELRNSNTVFLKELHGLLRLEKQLTSKNIWEGKLNTYLQKLLKKWDTMSKTMKTRIQDIIHLWKQFIDKQHTIQWSKDQIIQQIYRSISSELRNSEIFETLKNMDIVLLKKIISFLSINWDLDVFSANKSHYIGFPNPEETERIYSLCRSTWPLSVEEINTILKNKS